MGIPVDTVAASKAFTKLGLAFGATAAFSSKKVAEKSGVKDIDPMSLLVVRRIGVAILSYSIAAYFLLFEDASAATAVGLSGIPPVIELYKTLFDGTHKELG